MDAERKEGKSEELLQQEYYCSFDVGAIGSYYSKAISEIKRSELYCAIPIDPFRKIDVFFDLGRNDMTAMIFVQQFGKEIRIVDVYEDNNKAIDFYIQYLKDKNYYYGVLWVPHDGFAKRIEATSSVAQQIISAGFNVRQIPNVSLQNGIQTVRKYLPQLWWNKGKVERLLDALENYHREYDQNLKVFRDYPVHDWSSHLADSMRYLCIVFDSIGTSNPQSEYAEEARFLQQVTNIQGLNPFARKPDSLDKLDDVIKNGIASDLLHMDNLSQYRRN